MRIDLRITNRPLGDLWCQAVVMLSFKVQWEMSKALENLNKKMTGSIDSSVRSGLWSGERSEKLLFATQNTIKAEKLLLYGLGDEEAYSFDVLKEEINKAGMAVKNMGVREFGLFIPYVSGLKSDYKDYVETVIKDIADIYLNKHKDDPDYILKLYISIENQFMEVVEAMSEDLRDYFSPLSDFSIIMDRGGSYSGNSMSELAA